MILVALILVLTASNGSLLGEEPSTEKQNVVRGLGDAYQGSCKIKTSYINLSVLRETTPSHGIPFELVDDSTVHMFIEADSMVSNDSMETYRFFVTRADGETCAFTATHVTVDSLLQGTPKSQNVTGMLSRLLYLKAEAAVTFAKSEVQRPSTIDRLQSMSETEFQQSSAVADGRW